MRTLAGILRVAIALDRTHDGRVGLVSARRANGGGAIRLRVEAADGADTSLELQTAEERKGLLEDVLGHRVDVFPATR